MNVLFLTMSMMTSIDQRGIYTDLMRKFRNEGHCVYIVAPMQRREGKPTTLTDVNGVKTLKVRTLNVQKASIIEKGVGQVLIEYLFQRAIKKYLGNVHFDLILYSTPPITFTNVVKYAKKKNPDALTYLLLKDIFPQNAVDIGLMSKSGVKGILYQYFRNKEVELYKISDYIGCMSPANVKYLLDHNSYIDAKTVEVAPNSIEIVESFNGQVDGRIRQAVLEKYGLPVDKPIFIYGGNLGKPQGIPFLISCLEANKEREDCHFLIVGNGTEYGRITAWMQSEKPKSVSLFSHLPKEDYDRLVNACQVGLIFLDYRFTIPNYPSRLLPYLENKMPIIAVTDPNCDMGTIAMENGYGLWVPSNHVGSFTNAVDKILASDIKKMGEKGFEFLKRNYLVENTYEAIITHLNC
ncbi:glycosyltransferase family 4 protein [Bacteroides faecichinchillae]|uniref:glycosyltransferase family 4 protein n=1 Tax=Bacteroides faecichinchillae TaxID=871325 RepID=UPI0035121112